jgi:hypothetical protein
MAWNKHAAALHARQSAGISSQKRCGEFTRRAIRAGGADIGNAPNAKNYGREKIRQVTWRFMTVQPSTLISDKEICGVVRDIAPHALLIKFTGKADA